MIKAESFKELNCVVGAVSAITGAEPRDVIAGVASAAQGDEIPFYADGTINREVYRRWLLSQGWKLTVVKDGKLTAPIPLTCMVQLEGHCFAFVDGAIYDTGGATRFDRKIMAVLEPPASQRDQRTSAVEEAPAAVARAA